MQTKIIKIDSQNPKDEDLQEAVKVIKDGGLVIIPTETVYGIAANMLNQDAVQRLSRIKQRPENKPFSLLIDKKEAVEDYAIDVSISAYRLIDKFWPGPLTLVLKCRNIEIPPFPPFFKGGIKGGWTVGLRMPDNEIALKIISSAEVPIICPSANLSGKPAPVEFEQAIRDLDGAVDLAIDAGKVKLGIESSVVDLSTGTAQLLRQGAITEQEIEDTVKKKTVLFVCTGNSCRSVMAEAQLKKRLMEKNRQDVEVLSAGIMLVIGSGPTELTKQVLAKDGIDVSAHRSQKVTRGMLKKSDIILVMERLHEERILEIAPELKNRVFLLKEFAHPDKDRMDIGDKKDYNLDIDDPIGMSGEFYQHTFSIIKEAIEKIVEII